MANQGLVARCGGSCDAAPMRVDEVVTDLDRRIPELLTEHDLPGLAVGVCDSSGVLWVGAYGAKTTATPGPVTPKTIFSVQSCSKMYTATVVMLAVQRGLVDLDEPIVSYLPKFTVNSWFEPAPQTEITLRHLLSHTAGFTHEAPVGSNFLVGRESFAAHCDSIRDTWLRFPVGHHYEYSNLGIDLAGYVVQRVSGLPFHETARRWLFEPLGLDRTTFNQFEIARDDDRAIGHDRDFHKVPLRIPMVPAGGVYTSVEDACRFAWFYLAGGASVLEKGLVEQMGQIPFPAPGQTHGYGLGISLSLKEGLEVRGHNGGGFGFLADYIWATDHGIGVVVLTNSVDHPLQGQLALRILHDLTDRQPCPASPAATPAPRPHAAPIEPSMVGQYVGRGGACVTLQDSDHGAILIHDGAAEPVQLVTPGEFAGTDTPDHRHRIRPGDGVSHGYLQRLDDGFVWYRNPTPDKEPDTVGERNFSMTASGNTCGSVRLRYLADGIALIDLPDHPTLRLDKRSPGLFSSATGEVLDLTRETPRYANIRLHSQ